MLIFGQKIASDSSKQKKRWHMKKKFLVALYIVMCTSAALAQGGDSERVPSIPEIDAMIVPAVLALVGGGILVLRARLRSK